MVREGRAEAGREQGWNSPTTAKVVRVTQRERGAQAALILHHTGNSTVHLWLWSVEAFMAHKAVNGKERRFKRGLRKKAAVRKLLNS